MPGEACAGLQLPAKGGHFLSFGCFSTFFFFPHREGGLTWPPIPVLGALDESPACESMTPAATKGSSLGVALPGLHLYNGCIKLKKFFSCLMKPNCALAFLSPALRKCPGRNWPLPPAQQASLEHCAPRRGFDLHFDSYIKHDVIFLYKSKTT